MIRILFPEPTDTEWQEWRHKCDEATEALVDLVASGQKPSITKLYKDDRMKSIYKSPGPPFYGKCAYCESNVLADQPGDIEHWRPAGGLTELDKQHGEGIKSDTGTTETHPDYYWLAYDWRNRLLACADCNRPSKAKTAGKRIGKWDHFPVKGFRAQRPGEEGDEDPLLINPVLEDPSSHLEVDETGVIVANSDRGKACIDIFGLNDREHLRNARARCIKSAKNIVLAASVAASSHDEADLSEQLQLLKEIKTGEAPFSAAGRVSLGPNEGLKKLVSYLDDPPE